MTVYECVSLHVRVCMPVSEQCVCVCEFMDVTSVHVHSVWFLYENVSCVSVLTWVCECQLMGEHGCL
jgi:hypothetical protein